MSDAPKRVTLTEYNHALFVNTLPSEPGEHEIGEYELLPPGEPSREELKDLIEHQQKAMQDFLDIAGTPLHEQIIEAFPEVAIHSTLANMLEAIRKRVAELEDKLEEARGKLELVDELRPVCADEFRFVCALCGAACCSGCDDASVSLCDGCSSKYHSLEEICRAIRKRDRPLGRLTRAIRNSFWMSPNP